MRIFFSLLFSFALISGLTLAQDNAQDLAPPSSGPAIIAGTGGTVPSAPGAVLFDQGQLVNDPGGGSGGADRSFIESALGHTLYGWGHQFTLTYSMADDFTIPAGEIWTIDEVITFAYQTNAPTTSTITGVYAQIWDGDPSSGGTVIWGDLTTNIMTATTWSNIYRTTETAPTSTARAIMQQTSTVGAVLTEGTYWLEWSSDGSLSSGPWCPPVTILGVAVTGDALQNLAGTWGTALNGSEPNGAPFVLMGTIGGGGGAAFPEVLYYSFNEAGSDSTKNFAVPGSGFDWAQVIGAHTLGGAGQCGSALVAGGGSGGTDYVNTGWATDIGTSDWTISLWMNNITTDFGYMFGDNTAGSWRSFLNGAAGSGNIILRGGGMSDHVVAGVVPGPSVVHWVYDAVAGETHAYLNGVFVNTVSQTPLNITGSGPFKVGGYSTSTGLQPGSLIDEFRLYNRALDAAEVLATWDLCPVPVELTSFTASVNENDVTLNWETASEINNSGFQVERKSNGEYKAIGFVPGYGTTTEPKAYSFSDANLTAGTYSYRLKQIDYDGTFEYSDPVEVEIIVPDVYSLHQNYPNPFNPSTTITFTLAANANVTLRVFDVLGQEVMTLINQDLTAGVHTYDFDAASFNSGVYFYRIEANGNDGTNFTNVKKMILLK